MRDSEIRQSETIVRMQGFGVDNATDFPASSLGGQKFAALNELVAEIDRLGMEQRQGDSAAQASTEVKRVARNKVHRIMRAYSNTAEAMEPSNPGISDTFRMPKNNSDEILINTARAFAAAAMQHRDQFLEHEMPITFIDELTSAINEFENAAGDKNLNTRRRVSATAALRDALERGMRLRRELDPIVRNKYRSDPAKLAAWENASHIERAPRKKSAPSEATQPT